MILAEMIHWMENEVPKSPVLVDRKITLTQIPLTSPLLFSLPGLRPCDDGH
jgi:hypothetical protein